MVMPMEAGHKNPLDEHCNYDTEGRECLTNTPLEILDTKYISVMRIFTM